MLQINWDFEYLFKNTVFNLLENWHLFVDTIIKASDTTKIRNKEIKSAIEIGDNEISDGKSTG